MWKRLDPGHLLLTHDRLIWDRLRIDCWLRFAVVATIEAGGPIAKYVIGIHGLDVRSISFCGLAVLAYNLVTLWIVGRNSGLEGGGRTHLLQQVRHITIALDYLALTALLYWVGGARSPLLAVYLLHVVMSGLLESRQAAMIHTGVAYLLLAALVVGEWAGLLLPQLPAGAACDGEGLDGRYALGLLVVYGFLFSTTGLLVSGLAQKLRSGELALRQSNRQLELLSRNRRDFLHVALHNLQAPVSAATMMLEQLEREEEDGSLQPRQRHWLERSLARIRDSSQFLRDLQLLAALEGDNLLEQAKPVDVAALVHQAAEDTRDLREARHQELRLEVPPRPPPVLGIERLLREAVVNYLTNAIKYGAPRGHTLLRVEQVGQDLEITVEDDGIGVDPEMLPKLFHEFVRADRDPRVASVPGTGLGLSITRRIVEAHAGTVGARSDPRRGSAFWMRLPLAVGTARSGGATLEME